MSRSDVPTRSRPPGPEDAEGVEVVLVTAPDQEVAIGLARSLVEARLAACVNLVPSVRSVYRYEGQVHEDPEVLLVVKTCARLAEAVEGRLLELHPYDLPEVIRIPLCGGSDAYLEWVRRECRP